MICEGTRFWNPETDELQTTTCHRKAVMLVSKRGLDTDFDPPTPYSKCFWSCLKCYPSWERKAFQVMAILEDECSTG